MPRSLSAMMLSLQLKQRELSATPLSITHVRIRIVLPQLLPQASGWVLENGDGRRKDGRRRRKERVRRERDVQEGGLSSVELDAILVESGGRSRGQGQG
jgi:hypothetical protein